MQSFSSNLHFLLLLRYIVGICMASFFAEVKMFSFRPKTMDYNYLRVFFPYNVMYVYL